MFNLCTGVVLSDLRTTGRESAEAPYALTVPAAGGDRCGWPLQELVADCRQLKEVFISGESVTGFWPLVKEEWDSKV